MKVKAALSTQESIIRVWHEYLVSYCLRVDASKTAPSYFGNIVFSSNHKIGEVECAAEWLDSIKQQLKKDLNACSVVIINWKYVRTYEGDPQ